MNKLGAERSLCVCGGATDYTQPRSLDEILKRAADSYRRIRNTARFLLANLNKLQPATDGGQTGRDGQRWPRKTAQQEILKREAYDFHEVVPALPMRFRSLKWARSNLDIIKDRQ